jgi:hypothetical protein
MPRAIDRFPSVELALRAIEGAGVPFGFAPLDCAPVRLRRSVAPLGPARSKPGKRGRQDRPTPAKSDGDRILALQDLGWDGERVLFVARAAGQKEAQVGGLVAQEVESETSGCRHAVAA